MSEPLKNTSTHPSAGSESSTPFEKSKCALCGLPVGRSRVSQVVGGEHLCFCCPGCSGVFQMLFNSPDGIPSNFRETDLFRACVESGIIPRDENDPVYSEVQGKESAEESSQIRSEVEVGHAQDLSLRIDGMWCTACAWLVEAVLKRTKGVVETKVLFLADSAQVKYLPQFLGPRDICARIRKLGYRPSLFEDSLERDTERRDLLIRFGISAFLTANLMMISVALYMGFMEDLTRQGIRYLSYPLWFLATPVLFYGGLPILSKAISGLRYGHATMDTLISVGSLAAYFYSVVQVLNGSLHLYFDTASMLITLVLLGKYIESNAKERASRGLRELYRLAHQKVRLRIDGKERWLTPDALRPGDEFFVRSGERVPTDGRISAGSALLDESILTGEPRPLRKKLGDEALGGSLLLDGELRLIATRIANANSLNQMIQLMEEALSKKNPFELLADRMMRWFVPAVLSISAGTALWLLLSHTPTSVALLRAVTVVVIACPCALGIASPVAKLAAIGSGRERGLLIRDPSALEKVRKIDTFILDKTGTVTEGNFSLQDVITDGISKEYALGVIASVEQYSEHYLAREIVRRAHELALKLTTCEVFESFEGLGARGRVQGKDIVVGNQRFMGMCGMHLSSILERQGQLLQASGMTVVFFGWQGIARGFLVLGDALREGARQTVEGLEKRGIALWLVSGDSNATTRTVATELGIPRYLGQMLPQEKVDLVKRFQGEGRRVGMVGDGMNDAAALAQADVGMALGTTMNIAQEAADLTLMTDNTRRILDAFDLSDLTVRTVRQNLVFALVYNGLGIPLAVAGALNPVIAVIAMFASSLSVIGNSARIARKSSVGFPEFRVQKPKISGPLGLHPLESSTPKCLEAQSERRSL